MACLPLSKFQRLRSRFIPQLLECEDEGVLPREELRATAAAKSEERRDRSGPAPSFYCGGSWGRRRRRKRGLAAGRSGGRNRQKRARPQGSPEEPGSSRIRGGEQGRRLLLPLTWRAEAEPPLPPARGFPDGAAGRAGPGRVLLGAAGASRARCSQPSGRHPGGNGRREVPSRSRPQCTPGCRILAPKQTGEPWPPQRPLQAHSRRRRGQRAASCRAQPGGQRGGAPRAARFRALVPSSSGRARPRGSSQI